MNKYKTALTIFTQDILAGLILLTRMPAATLTEKPDYSRAMWSFPVIGFFSGALAALPGAVALQAGLGSYIAALISIAALMLLTGAMHEDGLADMTDGFGAGGSQEKIAAIMKDSQLGSYGTLSLILSTLLKIALLAKLADTPVNLILAMIFMAGIGRGQVVLLCALFPISQQAQLGQIMRRPSDKINVLTALLWGLPLFLILPLFEGFSVSTGIYVIGFNGLVMLWIGLRARHYLGGLTGDIMGACILLAELGCLFGLVISLL